MYYGRDQELKKYAYFLPNIIGVFVSFLLLIIFNIFSAILFFTQYPELLKQPWNNISSGIALAGFFLIPANAIIFFWISTILGILLSISFHFFARNNYENKNKKLVLNILGSLLFSFVFYLSLGAFGIAILFLI